ncbi:MAG: HD-GYP domain-containing protein [Planctomycetota bacterium]
MAASGQFIAPTVHVFHTNADIAARLAGIVNRSAFPVIENLKRGIDITSISSILTDPGPVERVNDLNCLIIGSEGHDDSEFDSTTALAVAFSGDILIVGKSAELFKKRLAKYVKFSEILDLPMNDPLFAEALNLKLETIALGMSMKDQIHHKVENTANLQVNIFKVIIKIIENKDSYTRFHSHSVTKWSRMLGRRLGLSESDLTTLGLGAVLHDIGKIGVPERILNKASGLTDAEMVFMRLHPVIGADLLAPLESVRDTLPIVMHHHERWDGKGYPDGIAGDEIPFNARIVAVADAFDTMQTRRSYKEPMTLDACIEQIKQHSGTQFDPNIVPFMVELITEEIKKTDIDRPMLDI